MSRIAPTGFQGQDPPPFWNMFFFSIKLACLIIRGLVYMVVMVYNIYLLLKCTV
jgi:hypothetical protein